MLAVLNDDPFDARECLRAFAEMAARSREYQGHGWGCALLGENGQWRLYKSLTPIWEDQVPDWGPTRLVVAHARSAFRNERIELPFNMPFCSDRLVFAFNGELHGVRLRAAGRNGAEKVFGILSSETGPLAEALRRTSTRIRARTRYVRAMNILATDGRQLCVSALCNEDQDYFTMFKCRRDHGWIVASEPLDRAPGWTPIDNDSLQVLP